MPVGTAIEDVRSTSLLLLHTLRKIFRRPLTLAIGMSYLAGEMMGTNLAMMNGEGGKNKWRKWAEFGMLHKLMRNSKSLH